MTASEPATESARLRAFRSAFEEYARAFNEGDYDRAYAGFRDDFEQHFPPGFTQRVLRGRAAVREFFEEFRKDIEDWRITPREYIEAGPRCYVVGIELAGVGRVSELPAAMTGWEVIDLDEEGRPLRVSEFSDRDEALAAAGIDDRGSR